MEFIWIIVGVIVGAVVGGLAGLYYGYDEIPKEWLDTIPKRDWIEELALKLV